MKKKLLLILALLCLLLLAFSPILAPDIVIDWWAIGPGSARLSNAGTMLHGMLGQGMVGQGTAGSIELCAGYLCLPTGQQIRIQLPLILK
jgi:hypothetical protein